MRSGANSAYDDEDHGDPHGQPASGLLAEHEGEDAAGEAAEVVDAHDDALERGARVSEGLQKVLVAHDPAEDALVVAEQDEGHLARDGDGGTQLEAAAKYINVRHGFFIAGQRFEIG